MDLRPLHSVSTNCVSNFIIDLYVSQSEDVVGEMSQSAKRLMTLRLSGKKLVCVM